LIIQLARPIKKRSMKKIIKKAVPSPDFIPSNIKIYKDDSQMETINNNNKWQ